MEKLISIFFKQSIYLIILNLACGIIATIWLLILGYWKIVLSSILICSISQGIIGILMIIPNIFEIIAISNCEKKWLTYICDFTSIVINALIMCGWGLLVLICLSHKADESSFIPLLIMSYVMATIPFSIITIQEPKLTSIICNFWFHISYILLIATTPFFKLSILNSFLLLASVMLIASIINIIIFFTKEEEK